MLSTLFIPKMPSERFDCKSSCYNIKLIKWNFRAEMKSAIQKTFYSVKQILVALCRFGSVAFKNCPDRYFHRHLWNREILGTKQKHTLYCLAIRHWNVIVGKVILNTYETWNIIESHLKLTRQWQFGNKKSTTSLEGKLHCLRHNDSKTQRNL